MSEKTLNNIRIVHKHDTEENWLKATNFIPKQGELIIYDIDDAYTYERFKIGNGVNLVSDLPFGSPDSAVLYTEQELTDEQQMQARKNQGLYYQQKIYNTTLENVEFINGEATIDYPNVTMSGKYMAIVQIDMVDSSGNIQHSFMGKETYTTYSTAMIEQWNYSGEEKSGNYIHSLEMYTINTNNTIITFSTNSALETSFTTNLVFYEIELKQIEEEYVPSTIARISDLESKADISLVTEVENTLYNAIVENDIEDKKYVDDSIELVNTSINNIIDGTTTVSKATWAANANNSEYAESCGLASSATQATQDNNGNEIISTYATKSEVTSQIATVESTLSNTIAENSLLISNLDTEVDTKANQTDLDSLSNLVGTTSVQSQISAAIADLVDSAPETLDTLSELATAIQENDSVIDTLDAAITQKADKANLEATNTQVAVHTTNIETLQSQVTATSFILADAITGEKYTIQIQNGQLVSFPVTEEA